MNVEESVRGIRAMVELATASGLAAGGEALKQKTRSNLAQYKSDSRLTKSVDFLVKGPGVESSYVPVFPQSQVKLDSETTNPRDKLPVPTQPLSLVFGAGFPASGAVEHGTAGPYTNNSAGNLTPEDGTFREKIMQWAWEAGMDSDAAERIADNIWANGTEAHPFMPSEAEIKRTIMTAVMEANRAVFSKTKLPDLVFKVGSK